ncbi:pre-mRNA-splicing factor Syf2-like [Nasonia vitripennis]|uniref:Pre-mRNA-splicing factor SYF2 n=1 Tax=Nasonia vitripennis TaxID=7425 RepID=A0A7M7G5E2_NASVI|nr:pre-mRNA-splicing factor Syf2-like [Nasonia vitripennis]
MSEQPAKTAAEKLAERMSRLKDLHRKRNEARTQNHQAVVAEDKRNKLPANWEARKRKADWILSDEKAREEAKEKGIDYERAKLLQMDALTAEKLSRKKKKGVANNGFGDFEQATIKQYNSLVKNIKPNMEAYEEAKEKLGPAFYGDKNAILHGLHKDKKEAVDRMVQDLQKQAEKRAKFSRRRTHNDDADIDFINDKNAKFNRKLEKFYGEYTQEIKQNLERGTAL